MTLPPDQVKYVKKIRKDCYCKGIGKLCIFHPDGMQSGDLAGLAITESAALNPYDPILGDCSADDMENAVWVDCMGERDMRKPIHANPQSEILWNAATVRLVADGLAG